jgi:hypothetical protein
MDDHDNGTHPLPPSKLQSPVLRKHGKAVAKYCFEQCYATWPELDARYGERGRQYTAEDIFWHLEHLDEAVSAGEPALFACYADWLVGLLVARGLEQVHIAGAFGFLAEALAGVECTARQEGHRRELIAVLRSNQARSMEQRPLPGF